MSRYVSAARIIDPVEDEIYLKSGDRLSLVCQEGDRLQPTTTVDRPVDQPSQRPAQLIWSRQRFDDATYTKIDTQGESQWSRFYTTSAVKEGDNGKEETTLLNDNVLLSDSATYRCQNNNTPSDIVKVKVIESKRDIS